MSGDFTTGMLVGSIIATVIIFGSLLWQERRR